MSGGIFLMRNLLDNTQQNHSSNPLIQLAQSQPKLNRPCDGTSDWRHINMATILSAFADWPKTQIQFPQRHKLWTLGSKKKKFAKHEKVYVYSNIELNLSDIGIFVHSYINRITTQICIILPAEWKPWEEEQRKTGKIVSPLQQPYSGLGFSSQKRNVRKKIIMVYLDLLFWCLKIVSNIFFQMAV